MTMMIMMMMTKKAAAAAAAATLLLLASGTTATAQRQQQQQPTPPSTGQEWISLDEGIEFQPSSSSSAGRVGDRDGSMLRQAQQRFLAEQQQQQSTSSSQNNVMYVDSAETYYDGYAQAWRYIGFYTDCNPNNYYDYDEQRRRRNRDLNSADEEEYPCVRYLLWAAYVDLSYTGLGIGEYQFFDTYAQKWDTSACETIGNGVSVTSDEETGEQTTHVDSSACKRMDCHLSNPNSHWQLLGYFKEAQYTSWFEQLFKHEGYCVWQNNEYNFMYPNYYAWPSGCTATETTLSDGTTLLYYDTKAIANGDMTYGLFTDSKCSMDYQGDEVTMESVLLNGEGSNDVSLLSLQYLDKWNAAMEIYKVCQPCRAYSLKSKNKNNNNNNNNDDYDPNNGLFQCYDAAGYTNVNQCMKFRTKTYMSYATLEQVMEAAQQGGVTSISVPGGRTYGSYMAGVVQDEDLPNWELLYTGCAVLTFGLSMLVAAMIWTKKGCCKSGSSIASLNEPLI